MTENKIDLNDPEIQKNIAALADKIKVKPSWNMSIYNKMKANAKSEE